jgi:ParB-like chromosome segregation protein Spo0J
LRYSSLTPAIRARIRPSRSGKSPTAFGSSAFTNPILVDAHLGVIAGHGRVEAAKLLGIERVPTIRLDHMNEAEKRAYIIADNKLAENAGWDRELLALELHYISELDLELDLTVTGLEPADIDLSLQAIDPAASARKPMKCRRSMNQRRR